MATLERRVERLESEVPAADDFRHWSLGQIQAELAQMEAAVIARAEGRELEQRDIESALARLANMTPAEHAADLAALEAEMRRRGFALTPA